VTVRLEAKGGKSHFLLGEPIEFELVFTGDDSEYGVEPDKDWNRYDRVTLTSQTPVFRWKEPDEPQSTDVFILNPLRSRVVVIPVRLNDVFDFSGPGTYTVSVTTSRLLRVGRPAGIPLTTNAVTFSIAAMPPQEEARRVRELTRLIDEAKDDEERQRAASELSTLRGDDAAREKVRLYLFKDQAFRNTCCFVCSPFDSVLEKGLALSTDKDLEIEAIDKEWRSPARVPNDELLSEMRLLTDLKEGIPRAGYKQSGMFYVTWDMLADQPDATPVQRSRVEEIDRRYYKELVATMTQRTGQNRADTALFLFDRLGREGDDAARATVRKIVLEQFGAYRLENQARLLRDSWETMNDPAIVPALEHICAVGTDPVELNKVIEKSDPDWRNDLRSNWGYATEVALIRLLEVSPENGRRCLLAELRASVAPASSKESVGPKDDTQAELDAAFLAVVQAFGPADEKHRRPLDRAMRYATQYASPAVYDSLVDAYRKYGPSWEPEERGTLLAYLMRWHADRAVALVQEEKSPGFGMREIQSMGRTYLWLGEPYPAQLREQLRNSVENGTDMEAGFAANQLSQHGLPEDLPVLERRLSAMEAEWQGKADLLTDKTNDPAAKSALGLERTLITALRRKDRHPSPGELANLKTGCVGEFCATLTVAAIPPEPVMWRLNWPMMNDYR
jgi:hypothetical protein